LNFARESIARQTRSGAAGWLEVIAGVFGRRRRLRQRHQLRQMALHERV
jgi:hypothetical protein